MSLNVCVTLPKHRLAGANPSVLWLLALNQNVCLSISNTCAPHLYQQVYLVYFITILQVILFSLCYLWSGADLKDPSCQENRRIFPGRDGESNKPRSALAANPFSSALLTQQLEPLAEKYISESKAIVHFCDIECCNTPTTILFVKAAVAAVDVDIWIPYITSSHCAIKAEGSEESGHNSFIMCRNKMIRICGFIKKISNRSQYLEEHGALWVEQNWVGWINKLFLWSSKDASQKSRLLWENEVMSLYILMECWTFSFKRLIST